MKGANEGQNNLVLRQKLITVKLAANHKPRTEREIKRTNHIKPLIPGFLLLRDAMGDLESPSVAPKF